MSRLLLALFLASAAGCASEVGKVDGQSMSQRQDAALKDPFGYNPDIPNSKTNIATSQPNKYDDSLKGDWGRFWNP